MGCMSADGADTLAVLSMRGSPFFTAAIALELAHATGKQEHRGHNDQNDGKQLFHTNTSIL